mmetsp:Transcript_3940/g.6499  ORF Transcript_3940/g.6499 Transcript_3940/m.6499 type:complete len:222 (+) Transcript_3940:751-1416(+)
MTSIIRVKVYVRGKHGFHLGNLEPFWFLAGIGSSIFRLSMVIVDVTTVHDQRSLLRRIEGHYRLVYDQGIACDDLGTLGRRIPLLPFESSGLFFFQFPHVFHVLPLAGLFFQFRLADVTFHDRTCPGGRMSGGPGAFAFVETVIPSWRWTLLLLSLLLLLLLLSLSLLNDESDSSTCTDGGSSCCSIRRRSIRSRRLLPPSSSSSPPPLRLLLLPPSKPSE